MTDNITVSRELLRQVLRLMDKALDTDNVFGKLHNDAMDCMGALEAALEQPAQKTCGRCVVFCQGGEGCHCNAPQISQRKRDRLVSDQLNRSPAVEPYDHGPQAETVAEALRDVSKWLNERPNRPLDLRHVAMLCAVLAEPAPVQEPVAVRYDFDGYGWRYIDSGSGGDWLERGTNWKDHEFVYTAQPRKAVKLTDYQISCIAVDNSPDVHTYARAIEAAVLKANGVSE